MEGADLEDVLQEVFHGAAKGLATFRREQAGDTFRGWLCAIAHNKVLLYWRSKRQQPEAAGGSDALRRLQELPEENPSAVEDSEEANESAALFHRALNMVRDEFESRTWQAFWRVTVDGVSAADAAAELGMTANAVRMGKSRVLRRLREELGDLIRTLPTRP